MSDPATSKRIGTVPKMGVAETRGTIDAANAPWRAKSAKEQAKILRKWFHLMTENHEDLCQMRLRETSASEPLGGIENK